MTSLPEHPTSPNERLIVALDFDTLGDALHLVGVIGESVLWYKVGLRLFVPEGIATVHALRDRGKRVFLDLKMHDIPETVRSAARNIADAGVEMLTVQGDADTVHAAVEGVEGRASVLFVPMLSSQGDAESEALILERGKQALEAGASGLIVSGREIEAARKRFGGKTLLVSPGIRPSSATADDHKRTLPPREAVRLGADYLVVGRPIREAVEPRVAAEQIIAEIA
ncbi:MAG: orotidine-5'-phosphate decarboxylase [Armatimonadota bacterium]